MNEKRQKLCRLLDQAVEAGELAEIDRILTQLDSLAEETIQGEDTKLFAARIKKLEKGRFTMHGKSTKAVLIAAALVVVASLGAYAASNWRSFQVAQGGRLVQIVTDDGAITQKDAKQLAKDEVNRQDDGNSIALEPVEYASIEEVQDALQVEVVLPKELPALPLQTVRGLEINDNDKMIWLSYGDGNRSFGVTISMNIPQPGQTTISSDEMDEGSMGDYKAKSGQSFYTITNTDKDGTVANIAFAKKGWTEYALIFVGFDEQGIHQVLDSVDLSDYE